MSNPNHKPKRDPRQKNLRIVHSGHDPLHALQDQAVPYSQEAEEAVIGAVLVNPAAFVSVAVFLDAADFFFLRHAYIWQAIERIMAHKDPAQRIVDQLTVTQELRDMGWLDAIGGPAFLTYLVNNTPSSLHAEVYGRLVERTAVRRRLLAAADEMKVLALNEQLPIEQVVSGVNDLAFAATNQYIEQGIIPYREVLSALYDDIEAAMNDPDSTGLPLGFKNLDFMRLYRGEVNYFCGLDKAGKTTFALNVAYNILKAGGCVVYLSREMSQRDLSRVLLAIESGIPASVLRDGSATPIQSSRIPEAMARSMEWQAYLVDQFETFSPLEISRVIRLLMRNQHIDLVIIDGFWLIEPDEEDRKKDFAPQQHTMSMKLKLQAEEFNLPYLVLHQLKSPADRRNKRPVPSDVAGGHSVRRNLQKLVFLHRDSHPEVNIDTETPDMVEVICAYDRTGGAQNTTGLLRWIPNLSQYADWSQGGTVQSK